MVIIINGQSYALTFKFDDLITDFANVDISVIIEKMTGEFVELRLVISLMVV